jgi:hypothetical protein
MAGYNGYSGYTVELAASREQPHSAGLGRGSDPKVEKAVPDAKKLA